LIVGWGGQFLPISSRLGRRATVQSSRGLTFPRRTCLWVGWCQQREKIDWQETHKFDCRLGWCGRFLFFVVPRQFSQVVGEWRENQILIPDWTYFHCPGATLRLGWCRQREKIDWQETRKFDCRLVRTIFIFCCPSFVEWRF